MKKLILFILLFSVHYVAADEYSRFAFNGNCGFTHDSAPQHFSKYWEKGLNLGFGVNYKVHNNYYLTGAFDYHLFKPVPDVISNGDGTVISLLASVKGTQTGFSEKAHPFYLVGIGVTRLKAPMIFKTIATNQAQINNAVLLQNEFTNINFSIHAAIGVDLVINEDTRLGLQAGPLFSVNKTDRIVLIPLKMGVTVEL